VLYKRTEPCLLNRDIDSQERSLLQKAVIKSVRCGAATAMHPYFDDVFKGLIACMILFAIIISMQLRWCTATMVIREQSFVLTVPLEFGLNKCFSEVCEVLEQRSQEELHKVELNMTTNGFSNITLPTSDSQPIPLSDSPGYQISPRSLHMFEMPFIKAASPTTVLLVISASFCAAALIEIASDLCARQTPTIEKRQVLILLLVAILAQSSSAAYYVVSTSPFLAQGGHYLDGIYVNCWFSAISLSALILLGVAQRLSKRYVYTQLSDGKFGVASAATTPEHSVQSSFSSFSQLATLYEEHDGEEQGLELDVITK